MNPPSDYILCPERNIAKRASWQTTLPSGKNKRAVAIMAGNFEKYDWRASSSQIAILQRVAWSV
jgi:hypothetical protein